MDITNKKARFDYDILDTFEAGIVLTGGEVKSLRENRGKLDGAFVRLMEKGAELIGAQIPPYPFSSEQNYDPKRTRRILLHKSELIRLKSKLESANLTLVPISWYTKGPRIKLEIGLGKGKKQFEKREKVRREDLKRDLERDFRGKVK